MTRKRRFKSTSPIRYQWKMVRLYGPSAPQAIVVELTERMKDEWLRGFGEFHNVWTKFLQTLPAGIPPMKLASYKAALNYLLRKRYQGFNLNTMRPQLAAVCAQLFNLSVDEINQVIDFIVGLPT